MIEHPDPPAALGRRRRVVAGTALAGGALLGASLAAEPGSRRFYGLTGATAATWVTGGLVSGPLHLGRTPRGRRPVGAPLLAGAGAFALFSGAARVARHVPLLDRALTSVLRYADGGPAVVLTTLANGAAEEVFFRGALYAALPQRPVVASTACYVVATLATRNPALVAASAVMGGLFAVQRRATGGILAPMLTHLSWSALMLRYLPPLFQTSPGSRSGVSARWRPSRRPR